MEIRGAGEALYIACEMEKRAIRLYERAMTVFAEGPWRRPSAPFWATRRIIWPVFPSWAQAPTALPAPSFCPPGRPGCFFPAG